MQPPSASGQIRGGLWCHVPPPAVTIFVCGYGWVTYGTVRQSVCVSGTVTGMCTCNAIAFDRVITGVRVCSIELAEW